MNEDILTDCITFRDQLVDVLENIRDAAQCIIPLNNDDGKTIQSGLDSLQLYIDGLCKAETPRDINRFVDVDKYLSRKDEIQNAIHNKRNHYEKLVQIIEGYVENSEG